MLQRARLHRPRVRRQPTRRRAATGRADLRRPTSAPTPAEIIQGVARRGRRRADVAVAVSHRAAPRGRRPDGAAAWVRELAAPGATRSSPWSTTLEPRRPHRPRAGAAAAGGDRPDEPARPGCTSIGSTNFAGGLAATQHLLALGHRRIAYLGGPAGAACNQARLQGYRAAMEAAGVAGRPTAYVAHAATSSTTTGSSPARRCSTCRERPTAVFAAQRRDWPRGVIEAARTRGLRVPRGPQRGRASTTPRSPGWPHRR